MLVVLGFLGFSCTSNCEFDLDDWPDDVCVEADTETSIGCYPELDQAAHLLGPDGPCRLEEGPCTYMFCTDRTTFARAYVDGQLACGIRVDDVASCNDDTGLNRGMIDRYGDCDPCRGGPFPFTAAQR